MIDPDIRQAFLEEYKALEALYSSQFEKWKARTTPVTSDIEQKTVRATRCCSVMPLVLGAGRNVVMLAETYSPRRLVAIKFYLDDGFHEAIRLASLQHPFLITFIRKGFAKKNNQRLPYLVTELIESTLAVHLCKHPGRDYKQFTWFIRRMLEAVEALAFLHDNGVAHGDIKPENIGLTSDDPSNRLARTKLFDLDGSFSLPLTDPERSLQLKRQDMHAIGKILKEYCNNESCKTFLNHFGKWSRFINSLASETPPIAMDCLIRLRQLLHKELLTRIKRRMKSDLKKV